MFALHPATTCGDVILRKFDILAAIHVSWETKSWFEKSCIYAVKLNTSWIVQIVQGSTVISCGSTIIDAGYILFLAQHTVMFPALCHFNSNRSVHTNTRVSALCRDCALTRVVATRTDKLICPPVPSASLTFRYPDEVASRNSSSAQIVTALTEGVPE